MKVSFDAFLFPNKRVCSQNKPNGCNRVETTKDSFANTGVSFTGSYVKGMDLIKKIGFSPLEAARLKYRPKLPPIFENGISSLSIAQGGKTESIADQAAIRELFPKTYGQAILTFEKGLPQTMQPHKIGVILSGGQAPGGHNVITGLYDALKQANKESEVFGFLAGPKGLIDGKYIKLNDELINKYRNQGGFDMIGSGRDKIEKEADFEKALESCKKLKLDAVTIIGGDDSNTNAALLAEWFAKKGEKISVIGCPKTIDGDLKNAYIETSFGFDTATKTYSETVGNIQRDALSSKKQWHFIKVMGRSASHIALEMAHKTHPNITLISEEIAQKSMTLDGIVTDIANTIARRAEQGKNYGIAVIPEGIIEFIPEFKTMIAHLDKLLPKLETDAKYIKMTDAAKAKFVKKQLKGQSSILYASLPANIKNQLITEKRDSHGNFPGSKLETEMLIIDMLKPKLAKMKAEGTYKGKFEALSRFSGYDGRAGLPSNFDSDYCYSLGHSAAALIDAQKTGYLATVRNLDKPTQQWQAGGTPITMIMNMEERSGEMKPVIQKALVDLDGPVFKELVKNRETWAMEERYLNPGPIQFFGPSSVCDLKTHTLMLEKAAKK